ncbi:RlpA-like double-psi beta-barrel-protein domain-containing protein-containing protein [Poronia punctata]|nr:RlpA-like double-psi beta-barrel-protein domain-containing protein-containing protein [Poronia punctata]
MPSLSKTLLLLPILLLTTTPITLALPTPSSDQDLSPRKQTYAGEITYYEPGLGACGWTNGANELVAAVSPSQYSGNCGKRATIRKDGKTVHVKVVDKCPGCKSGSIDVSPAAFKTLADLGVGRTGVTWSFD